MKYHLAKSKFKKIDGQVMAKIKTYGEYKFKLPACGRQHSKNISGSGFLSAAEFSKILKNNPEDCCKKCAASLSASIKEAERESNGVIKTS